MANEDLPYFPKWQEKGSGSALRVRWSRQGVAVAGDQLIGFCLPCDECGEFFEAETTPDFLDLHGVLCDGHRCANA